MPTAWDKLAPTTTGTSRNSEIDSAVITYDDSNTTYDDVDTYYEGFDPALNTAVIKPTAVAKSAPLSTNISKTSPTATPVSKATVVPTGWTRQ